MKASQICLSWARWTCRQFGRAALGAAVLAPTLVFAADTIQDFSANFPPPPGPIPLVLTGVAALVPGSLTGDPSVNFLRICQDNVGANGQAGLGQVLTNTGPYDSIKFEFDFQNNDPAAGADGFSFAYLPVALHGQGGAAPGLGEEPNTAGALGIGIDTWNNDDATDGTDTGLAGVDGSLPDSLSLHFNGARLASVSMLHVGISPNAPGNVLPAEWLENGATKHAELTVATGVGGSDVYLKVTEPTTGLIAEPFGAGAGTFVAGLAPYDGRIGLSGRTGGENQNQDVDNVVTTFDPAGAPAPFVTVVNNFDNPVPPPPPDPTPLGGTHYTPFHNGGGGPNGVITATFAIPPGGGDADGQYQLTPNVGDTLNSIAFDKTLPHMTAGGTLIAGFDIRVQNNNANTADGMSFMLLDTNVYGDSGPASGLNVSEDPNNPNSLALGFDTFDNDEDFVAGDPTGCGGGGPCLDRKGNSISVHVNGAQVDQQFIANGIDYNDGNWLHVDVALSLVGDDGSALMDVIVTDTVTGDVFQAFGGLGVIVPTDLRLAFGARTGGEFDIQTLDNVFATYIPVPEPTTFVLLGLGAIGLFVARRRRK